MLNRRLDFDVTAELFSDAINRAQGLPITELLECAEKLKGHGERQRVVDLYKTWIAYNSDHQLLYAIYFNYGVSLLDVSDHPGAINALRETIRIKPDFSPPYINLGNIMEGLGHTDRAVGQWMNLVNMFPAVNGEAVTYKSMALKQIGRVLEKAQNDSAAEDALRQSLDINPEQPEVKQHWISLRQRQCKWPAVSGWENVQKAKLLAAISPLSVACYTDDPMFQLAVGYQYNKKSIGMPAKPRSATAVFSPDRRKAGKLRIGYVSSDLRNHAVGFAMTEVVELHNRENVEVFAYYCGIEGTDATQSRIKAAVDHWLDINPLDDEQAAAKIREDEIDILVDLNGYTKDARTKVFSLRPAPINVNWFGFPSSMASPYHHYIIADPYIIPENHEIYYSEKVLRMPCYQPNDRKRIVATHRPTRKDANLPENAFVYCCLNGMQKLTAITFERWMNILRSVDNSVLWLLSGTSDTNTRLQQMASQQGVAPERLIFAERRANPDHLARYPLADLFLDNLPYGAHTTAADSMWMGVPILTLMGRSFASRVCASLLHAAGTEELICASPAEYIARAIELGRDKQKYSAIKQKLVSGRDTCLLFDTPQLVRNLEGLYQGMWADYLRGDLPRPDLRNLDIYHEIGLELDLEKIELLPDPAYFSLYREKLDERHSVYPIGSDARLWQN
jgi:predicted O-linked N-acetylglucosamine transferase (SPINDLY family)